MKTLKVCIVVILITVFISCYLINDNEIYDHVSKLVISSTDMFSIDGKVYNSASKYIPFTVYNPNKYSINITIDGNDYTIKEHETFNYIGE